MGLIFKISIFLSYLLSISTFATNYNVGPQADFASIQAVVDLLNPGDTVFVAGNNSYPADIYIDRSGSENNWIVIKGIIPDGGARPVITGEGNYGINISADFVVVEGFQVSDMPKGIGVFGNNILVRGSIINGCNHGLIGYGTGTGNVTVEYCEFYGNGVPTGGATQHQIYMATDEESYPGAIFRLQFSYLHDAVEGDNVKSRSERNEIYYNWIENAGSSGHGLGLFAPDPEDNANVEINTAREDADVVGNVIIQARNSCARIGGDAPGYPTDGRYRFVNNTFVLTGNRGDVIRTFNRLETLEMYNNIMYALPEAGDFRVLNDADGDWVHSPRSVLGSHNWIKNGFTNIPSDTEFLNSLQSANSPFANAQSFDFYPAVGNEIVNAGAAQTPGFSEYPLENVLFPPVYHPPERGLPELGSAQLRIAKATLDLGAFEAKEGMGVKTRKNAKKIVPKIVSEEDKIQLLYYVRQPEKIEISIISLNGELNRKFEILTQKTGINQFQIPKKGLGTGVYMLQIAANDGVQFAKVILIQK